MGEKMSCSSQESNLGAHYSSTREPNNRISLGLHC